MALDTQRALGVALDDIRMGLDDVRDEVEVVTVAPNALVDTVGTPNQNQQCNAVWTTS